MEFEKKRVSLSEIGGGKMQREGLPSELESRIRQWWKRYGKSIGWCRTFEDWERGFCEDMCPHMEAALFGAIFTVFENHMLKCPKDDPKQVLGELSGISMGVDLTGKRAKVLHKKWVQEYRRIDWKAVVKDCLELAQQEGTYDIVCGMFEAQQ